MNRWTDEPIGKQTDRKSDSQIWRWTVGRTDTQTDVRNVIETHTDVQINGKVKILGNRHMDRSDLIWAERF
jgi:hypothetical protein